LARSAKIPCRYTLCPALLDKPGYCDKHASERYNKHEEHDKNRATSTQRGYGYRWQKAREAYLKNNPLCVQCERDGRVNDRELEIDHIVPINIAPDRQYDLNNWQVLCKSCHSKKTAQDKVKYRLGMGGLKL